MKKLIITIALTITSSAAFANGFSPWDERTVSADIVETNGAPQAATTGFAPWQTHANHTAFADEKGIAMDIKVQNVFRPWS